MNNKRRSSKVAALADMRFVHVESKYSAGISGNICAIGINASLSRVRCANDRQLIQRPRFLHRVFTRTRTSQATQQRAAAEPFSQVVRNRSNIGARRARNRIVSLFPEQLCTSSCVTSTSTGFSSTAILCRANLYAGTPATLFSGDRRRHLPKRPRNSSSAARIVSASGSAPPVHAHFAFRIVGVRNRTQA